MRSKRILGILMVLTGILLIFFAQYISGQVAEGKIKIADGQQKVDEANKLFSYDPLTKDLGKVFTDPGQRKINRGKQEVSKYEEFAKWLQIGGIVLSIAGALVIFFGGKKSGSRR